MKRSALALAIAVLAVVGCSSGTSSSKSPSASGSSKVTTTSTVSGGSTASSAIPDSAAIDALTKDLTKRKAAELVAKCNVLSVTVRGNNAGLHNDPAVKESLSRLVAVVRPLAPAVADALAKDATTAAAWCKAKGMTP